MWGVNMYTSIIEIQIQSGKMDEALEITEAMKPDLAQLDGLRQFIVIDKGNDAILVLAIYDSQAQQEAAGPKAQELLGRMGALCTAAPERKSGDVKVNEHY